MKTCVALFFSLIAFAAPSFAEKDFDDAHRFIFYSVLEGCFEDGLSTEDVSQILLRRPKESYFHFIYSCPICGPTIHALEVYRSRPAEFYGLKSGASTFGPGLTPELKKPLYSEQSEDRLGAINSMVQRWIAKRMSLVVHSDEQRDQLQKAIEEKRKRGMEALKRFKTAKFESGDHVGQEQVFFYAPAFATLEECAVCNAAVGKKLKMGSLAAAVPFPEMPEGPIEKVQAWKILDQQWSIIEPLLFTDAGKAHVGRSVRFESSPVTIGKILIVRTAAGTTASVANIPKGDMDLVREFRKPPRTITVEGVLTGIDPVKRTITIKAFGVRPSK